MSTEPLKILALPKYGKLGASSRMRILSYLPSLQAAGLDVHVEALLEDAQLQARYRQGGYRLVGLLRAYWRRVMVLRGRRSYDVLWIEKEALPWWPLWAELALLRGVPYVLDYDDAVFHNYDMHRLGVVRRLYGERLDGLMAKAALVVTGNDYLAQRARKAGARKVEVVPTVIDLERYPRAQRSKTSAKDGALCVVWIGSPSTVKYLQLIAGPLQALAGRLPFVLRVIGGGEFHLAGVKVEVLPWSEDSEVQYLQSADLGVMPLEQSPWERGKCGYKLIQYMASGLPVLASNVGVNSEIVRDGENGYLACTSEEWLRQLASLLQSPALRTQLGQAGRRRVEERYCFQRTGPLMARLLRAVAGKV